MTNVIQSAFELNGDGTLKGRHVASKCSSSPGLGKKRLDARSYKVSLLKGLEKRSQESAPKKKQKTQGEASQEDGEHVEASSSKQVDQIYGGAVRSREEVGVIKDVEGSDRENGELLHEEFESPASKFSLSWQPAPVLSTKKVASITELQASCSTKGNIAEVSLGTTTERTPDSGGSLKRKRDSRELDSDDPLTEKNEVINSSADPVSSKPNSNMAIVLEHCDACSERQRSEGTSEKCNMCSCNYVKNRDTCNNSSLEVEEELSSKACIGLNEEPHNKVPEKSPMHTNTDSELSFCTICKLGGKLLSCNGKGCKTNYHIYCLDPPLKVVPPGVWHCVQCIKKKIQFGVHSISEGMESVCDVKEEEVPVSAGFQKQKQYLVKYKGLAHVHNRWVSEHELFLEAPSLVAKCRKPQTPKWKREWSKPQRMVLKRVLMSPTQSDGSFNGCQYEWFVKWCGLGYEHATWELENASFLRSEEVMPLVREYESRRESAIWSSNPSNEKLLEKKKRASFKLSEFSGSNASGLHHDHLNFVNKLREYWSRNENVVVLENQERVLKVVSYIQSMKSDVCRPFLVISTSSSISAWESEFMRVAPSVSVVVYNGNKDVRETIRALEFYEDGGCVMLQVLLAPIDAVVEDLEALEFIGWEAIIVDECQLSRVSRHFEQINKLTHIFKILLLSGQLKETIAEYLNLLTFVESGGDWKLDGNLKDDSRDTMSKLKERFARFIACEEKFEPSKFVEYWVPVQLSNVQCELYCASLFANSISLKSSSKTDILGARTELLKSVQRCCDHPYLVDQSLRGKLRGDLSELEYFDVDVNASGKIQMLDKILTEIKRRGLRALILFQSADFKRNYIGEFLEDLLRQRFGVDSYERIDNGLSTSKKQAAVNLFNNIERGRFVFLTDYRACKQSVKLSSVDLVILFNSSWNPQDDLRALQKLSIDSQFEQINVFRLYSCCTVEEKVLSLAKQAVALDSNNIRNISCSTSHSLLLWGAHFQFHKLDKFHNNCTSFSDTNIQQSCVNDLVQEMLTQLRRGSESESKSCNIIAEAPQRGATYIEDIPLAGEKEMQSKDNELPHVAWKSLFDGRYPRWRFASEPFQRIRRKVQNFDELPEIPRENEEPPNKRKKVVSNTNDPSTVKGCLGNKRKSMSMDKEVVSATPSYAQNDVASTDNEFVEVNLSGNWHDSQKNLYLSLKPRIMKLCEILNLPDEVKSMAGRFLEYIMNNHKVNQEPVSIYQAFQISLCWSAVSLSNYKFSRKNSVSRVKQHLDYFQCSEEEVEKVYLKLQILSKMFRQQTNGGKSHFAENLSVNDKAKLCLQSKTQSNSSSQQHLGGAISPPGSSHQRLTSDSENAISSLKNVSSKRIEHVKKIHSGRMKKLFQKQQEEFEKFKKYREMVMEKQGRKEELDDHLKSEQSKLEDMQRKARNEEKQKKSHWLEVAESGRSVSPYANVPLSDSGFSLENMEEIGKDVLGDDSKQDPPVSVSSAEVVVAENCATENPPLVAVQLSEMDVNMNTSLSEYASHMGSMQQKRPCDSDSMLPSLGQTLSGLVADQEHATQTLLGQLADQEHSVPAQDNHSPFNQVTHGITDQPSTSQPLINDEEVPRRGPLNEDQHPTSTEQSEGPSTEQTQTEVFAQQLEGPSTEQTQTEALAQQLEGPCTEQIWSQVPAQLSKDPSIEQIRSQVPAQQFKGPTIEQIQSQVPAQQSEGPSIEQIWSLVPAQLSEGPSIEQIKSRVPAQQSEGLTIKQIESQVPAQQSEGPTIEQIQSQVPAQQYEGHSIEQNQSQIPTPIEQFEPQVPSTTCAIIPPPEIHSAPQHLRVLSDSFSIEQSPSPSTQHTARSIPTQPHLLDPLQNELGRLRREQEQTAQKLENEKIRIRLECEKAMEAIHNKYKNKIEQAEMELAEKKKAFDLSYNIVYKNRLLAEAFKLKVSSAGVQGNMQQQRPTITAAAAATTNPGPSRPSPPVQTVYQPSALFSSNPVRPSSSPMIQSRGRAPAPHLQQRYRPAPSPYMLPSQQPYAPAAHFQPLQMQMLQSSQQLASYHQYGLSSLELLADMNINPNPNPP